MNEYIWPMKLLENKIAIVTGASRGIGEAIALKLAAHGAHIAFTYLSSEEKAKALEDRLKGLGVREQCRGIRGERSVCERCGKGIRDDRHLCQ